MDNLTHTLFAVTLARTPLARAGRGTTAALLIASNVPDVDIVAAAGGALSYLHWHRGPTHGPLGIAGLGLMTAAAVRVGDRWITGRGDAAPLARLWAVAACGVLFHVMMDLPTSYGTRALSPLDWRWFALDWVPIIDPVLWVLLGGGLLIGAWSANARRRLAALVLALMAVHYGIRAAGHRRAIELASTPPAASEAAPIVTAIPTFLSPFSWRLIVARPGAYDMRDVDVLAREHARGTSPPASFPNVWSAAVFAAARSRTAQIFLGFSRTPTVRATPHGDGSTTVRWTDLRFVDPSAGNESPRSDLFTAAVRIDAHGRILDERLGR
jgi:inner membrane protein